MNKKSILLFGVLATMCMTGCNSTNKSDDKKDKDPDEKVIEDYDDDGSEHETPIYITNNFGQDASTELIVQWQNVDGSTNQRVQITTEDDTDFTYAHNVEGEYRKLDIDPSVVGNYDKNGVYKAKITGLKPNTNYIYRVGANDAWSQTYNHLTADEDFSEFSFIVTSDPQAASHTEFKTTMTRANEYDPENRFAFMCGDLVDDMGKRPAEIKSYTNAASEFNNKRIIACTEGNHDTYRNVSGSNVYQFGEATIFNAFTTQPDNGFVKNDYTKSNSYYFTYNNVLFITLNTLIDENDYSSEAQWLENVLKDNDDADYIIATMHIGPFAGKDDREWREPLVRQYFLPIFAEFEVDAVFYGHDHTYGRSNPLKFTGKETATQLKTIDTTPVDGGTIFSMVGATGPKFYSLDHNLYQDNIFAKRSEATPGSFVDIKVEDDQLTVNAIRLPSTTGAELINMDSYTIPKKSR